MQTKALKPPNRPSIIKQYNLNSDSLFADNCLK